jgi:DNA polymerase III epsilon subunit-like protein
VAREACFALHTLRAKIALLSGDQIAHGEGEMEFVAIDVETANADMASICQIGIARFANGALTDEWKTYVDPQDYFDGMNVSIHGIDKSIVAGAPTFGMVANTVKAALNGRIVVTHTQHSIRLRFIALELSAKLHCRHVLGSTQPASCGELGKNFQEVVMACRTSANRLATNSKLTTL